jgi:diacylglycerol O-acyltransferase
VAHQDRHERLSALDVSNLRVEDHGMPMHVAALMMLESGPLLDSSGNLRLPFIRRLVEQRTRQAPRLRQVLVRPRAGLGPPYWADDETFDVARHLRTRHVSAPGDEAALLGLVSELDEPRLDRSRPLWEMWLITGLADGRVAMLVRLHHVVADGLAALALMRSLFDPDPGGTAEAATPGVVAALPQRRSGFMVRGLMGAREMVVLARRGSAPRISWNRPVGRRRRLMLVRADLAAAKAVAHRHGGRLNDVVLAAVASGARRLLESRGELTPDLVLNVSVAVSVRSPEDSGGNRVAIRVVPVAVGDADVASRLEAIAAETSAQRHRPPLQPSGRLLQRWMVGVMNRQRLVNLLLSNLPGPQAPLYFAGARVEEMLQVGVVQGNLALAVGVLSYAGQLDIDVVADADVVPDLDVFTSGVREALEELAVV